MFFFFSYFFPSFLDVIFMEGHTEVQAERNDEVLAKLARRHTYSNLLDVDLGPHSSPMAKQFSMTLEQKLNESESKGDDDEEVTEWKPEPEPEPTVKAATMDPRVVSLVTSMTSKLSNLAGQVDHLSARVDNLAAEENQPMLMVPQKINMNMVQMLNQVGVNFEKIDEKIGSMERRSSSPVMMVPAGKDGTPLR